MRRIAALFFAALLAAAGGGAGRLSQPADHPGLALRAGRRQRFPRPHAGRGAEDAAEPDGGRPERRRCGQRGRLAAGRQGQARRLHAAAQPYRHVDRAGALQEARLRSAAVLRVHRPLRRGADDDHGAPGLRAPDLRRAGRLRQGQQGEVHRRLRRAWAASRISAPCCSRRRSACRSPWCSTRAAGRR